MAPEDRDRRQQILDAAQQVFAQKGFEGASIKDLAKAAKISPGLLYWYFKDKTDLFVSLISERIKEAFGTLLPENVSFDLPPEEFLPQFGRFYINLFEWPMNAAMFKVMVANAQSFPEAVHQVRADVIGLVLDTLQGYFQRQIDAGQMRPGDTEMVARTFMGSTIAFLLLRIVLQDKRAQDLSVEAFVDGITDVVLHGILPQDKP
jgi:TetR/AcrR family transcriptional regulator, mexJK operon transcriptional repressor